MTAILKILVNRVVLGCCHSRIISESAVGIFLTSGGNEGNCHLQLTELCLNHITVMLFYDIICSLKAICRPHETERCWYLTTRNNMPFNSNACLTREKDIRYGTSLKNSTDNLHTAMALNKCQILSAVCTEELLHPICPHESEEPGD